MSTSNRTEDELALAYNPFEGDFCGPGDRILTDKICMARKPGPCHYCGQMIEPGTKARRLTGVYDGQMMWFRWCSECCAAMAASWTDNGDAITARFALRRSDQQSS